MCFSHGDQSPPRHHTTRACSDPLWIRHSPSGRRSRCKTGSQPGKPGSLSLRSTFGVGREKQAKHSAAQPATLDHSYFSPLSHSRFATYFQALALLLAGRRAILRDEVAPTWTAQGAVATLIGKLLLLTYLLFAKNNETAIRGSYVRFVRGS